MNYLERRCQLLESQHQMALPQMTPQMTLAQMNLAQMNLAQTMYYQSLATSGIPPHSMNMHQSYQQGSPNVEYPPSMGSNRNGHQMPMTYNHGHQGRNFQGMHGNGYSNEGADGGYADEENMMN